MVLDKYLPRLEFDSYEDLKHNYTVREPDDFNFGFDVVDEWARQEPDKRALVWCDDSGAERTFTFTEISRLSSQTAWLLQSLGVKKGDRVMLILRRRWEYWVAAVACHKLGAINIPTNLQMAKKDIVYRANTAGISCVFCVDDAYVVEQMEAALPESPSIHSKVLIAGQREGWLSFDEAIASFPTEFPRPAGDDYAGGKDTMLIYFTSGTTSMPKMVAHNYLYPLGQIVTAKYWQQVEENCLHMSVSDSGWAKFGWGKIYGQWLCGAVIFAYDMDKFHGKTLLEMLEKYRVTTFCVPPTMYRFMLQEDLSKYDLSSLHHCATAGEPLNPEVVRRWKELTGHTIYEGFGQSETTVVLANFGFEEPRPGSTGKPSPLYDVRILDDEGNELEDGEEGLICICSIRDKMPPGLFTSYYGDAERTQQSLGGEYYSLGDMAWRDSDGYLWFVGRSDDVIKSSGYRIGPFEVESALIEHPAVVECAITAVPDPVRGQIVKATIVLARGWEASDALIKELQEHVKKTTAPYNYPRIVEFVDELPKTVGGKIKRAQLRAKDAEGKTQK